MGKTADQKAIIDTLKQEGKTQKEISERIGCSQSAVSRHLSGKSVGRKKCGKKRCTTRRGDRTMRKIVEKDRFQTLEDLRKQWTESGVETSRATVHRRVQKMGYRCRIPQVKPLLNQKQRQKRLTWATEKQHWTVAQWLLKFCMSFGNQGARVWRKTGEKEMPKCLKSSVKYPQSVMVWGAMSAAGVGPLCFIKGRVNAASYQEILEHSMLPSAEKLYGDEDFILQHDLAPAHSAKTTVKWFTDHGITVLNWPANSSDLNPIEDLWDIVKRKLRDARPNTLDELKAAIEASWASITPQQCHRLITAMPHRIEAVISAKRIPDQYPGSAPESLVLISDTAKDVKPSDVDQRFTTKIRKDNQNRVDLEISSAEVSDSAVYYCALRPTVTGNTRAQYKNLPVFHSVSFGDEITADRSEEFAAVASTVTLSCSYSSAYLLLWYRQYPGSAPEILVFILEGTKETKTSEVDPSFSTKTRKEKEIKHVDLEISSATVSDSAVYYCALRPTYYISEQNCSFLIKIKYKLYFFTLYNATHGNEIKPTETEEFAVEGSSVKLSCSYSSAYSLQCYRQYPGSAPEFLELISDGAKEAQKSNVDSRFTTEIRKEKQNYVDLEISSAALKDSAVYYCALEPTVTGNTRTLYKNLLLFRVRNQWSLTVGKKLDP
ncbi:unnamed protein product [Leuciscus chuanchicus]